MDSRQNRFGNDAKDFTSDIGLSNKKCAEVFSGIENE